MLGTILRRGAIGGASIGLGAGGSYLAGKNEEWLRAYHGDEAYTSRFGTAGADMASGRLTAGFLGAGIAALGTRPWKWAGRMAASPLVRGGHAARGIGRVAMSPVYKARHTAARVQYAGARRRLSNFRSGNNVPNQSREMYEIIDRRRRSAVRSARGDLLQATNAMGGAGSDFRRAFAGIGVGRKSTLAAKGGMYVGAPAFAGVMVGANSPRSDQVPGEGFITDVRRGSAVRSMNFSTAGLVQALHNARRTA